MVAHGGVSALHEPFCNLKDFGETDVGGRVLTSAPELISAIYGLAVHRLVFFKDTTDSRHAAVLGARRLLARAHHAFLIRRPEEVAASYYALRPEMTVGELGFENLYELYQAVTRAGGRTMVIDSDDLVANPAGTLRAYCAAAGIPFRERMLRWEMGARHEWRRSSRWHQAVSGSEGFVTKLSAYRESVLTNAMLAACSAHHEPYYQLLYARRTCPPAAGTPADSGLEAAGW